MRVTKDARHFDIDEITGRKMAFGFLRGPLIEGVAGAGSERSASQRKNFLDNDWGEARVVNGARSIVVAVPYVACRLMRYQMEPRFPAGA